MQILKEDLSFTHYRWGTDQGAFMTTFSGEPSRRIFDPQNGNQVLFLINYYASVVTQFTVKEAQFIESQIVHNLPPELKSERSVYTWIMQMTAQAQ